MGTGVMADERPATLPATGSTVIPTTGMRGGLGRTLLTAFLILTIVPLALIGWYALQQDRHNLQQEVEAKLEAIATLKAREIRLWLADRQRQLALLLPVPESEVATASDAALWAELREQVPDLIGVVLLDEGQSLVWSAGDCEWDVYKPAPVLLSSPNSSILISVSQGSETLVACLQGSILDQVLHEDVIFGRTGRVYLVQHRRIWPGTQPQDSEAITELEAGNRGVALYTNHQGTPVVGAYYSLPDLNLGVLVEQEQAETLESSDRIAATLIAVILAVALATTAIAAIVIRQITRPVIRLTESALQMTEGNLNQYLPVTSRDEIGILTYVFNEMAADLKSLYEDLEAKVVERTQMLQRANYQIQRRAIHLQASLEVSQASTSIRDPEILLNRVADLIRDSFVYTSAAIYLLEPGGGVSRRRAVSPTSGVWPIWLHPGDGTVMERALRKGTPQVESYQTPEEEEWYRRTLSQAAVPLQMGERAMGVIAVLSAEREGVQEEDLRVLQHVANQVAIALENARAYERERLAAQQLEEAEVFKVRFLENMSHELREPLNIIIGFSRLMLKGLDGELSEQQALDLQRIHESSQHLLSLITDILTISQLQAGLVELELRPVNISEVIASIMPTASALIRGKEIQLEQQIQHDLPEVKADPARIRQILVRLLTNAAKFTHEGSILIRAWSDQEMVYVSVSDTGVGIPPEDRERVFVRFEKGSVGESLRSPGAGLGLALSREFLEMHGGQIWLESEVGQGSTFTFSLPIYQTP